VVLGTAVDEDVVVPVSLSLPPPPPHAVSATTVTMTNALRRTRTPVVGTDRLVTKP